MAGGIPESEEGLYPTLAAAEVRAAELQAEGRETKIEESMFHLGFWIVLATEIAS